MSCHTVLFINCFDIRSRGRVKIFFFGRHGVLALTFGRQKLPALPFWTLHWHFYLSIFFLANCHHVTPNFTHLLPSVFGHHSIFDKIDFVWSIDVSVWTSDQWFKKNEVRGLEFGRQRSKIGRLWRPDAR